MSKKNVVTETSVDTLLDASRHMLALGPAWITTGSVKSLVAELLEEADNGDSVDADYALAAARLINAYNLTFA